MPFSSTALIKIFLILLPVSHIAIAGPVPDVGSDISIRGREQVSSGSVSSSNQGAGSDFIRSPSGKGGKVEKVASHNKGVGGSSLAGTRHKQGNTVGQSADPFSTVDEPAEGESADGGSATGAGGGFLDLNILSGNGGAGGERTDGTDILNILNL